MIINVVANLQTSGAYWPAAAIFSFESKVLIQNTTLAESLSVQKERFIDDVCAPSWREFVDVQQSLKV